MRSAAVAPSHERMHIMRCGDVYAGVMLALFWLGCAMLMLF
jgi:hypothetical protein